jgi:hypothetical protein
LEPTPQKTPVPLKYRPEPTGTLVPASVRNEREVVAGMLKDPEAASPSQLTVMAVELGLYRK